MIRVCPEPGCPLLADECAAHRRGWTPDTERGSKNDRGYGSRWNRLRKATLRRDRRCVLCGSTDELTVDHITPKSEGGLDELDNLRTLCGPCHRAKTAQDAARGRERSRTGAGEPSSTSSTNEQTSEGVGEDPVEGGSGTYGGWASHRVRDPKLEDATIDELDEPSIIEAVLAAEARRRRKPAELDAGGMLFVPLVGDVEVVRPIRPPATGTPPEPVELPVPLRPAASS